MYLQVTTLSDIVEATGQYLSPSSVQGHRHWNRNTLLLYPKAPVRPPNPYWTTWRRFLRQLVSNPNTAITTRLKPEYLLGSWFSNRHETWKHTYSPATNRLYITEGNSIRSYPKLPLRGTRFLRRLQRLETSLPPDNIPISIDSLAELTNTGLPTLSTSQPPQPQFHTTPNSAAQLQHLRTQVEGWEIPDELHDCIADAPTWQLGYIQFLQLCPDFVDRFTEAYTCGRLRSGSDGSAPHHGSFAWKVIDSRSRLTLAQGGGVCCHFPGLTSHRMEAAGMLGGTDIFLSLVQRSWSLPTYDDSITHICDNMEAVNRYNTPIRQHTTTFAQHDMDLHMAIDDLQTDIPQRQALWTRGHQDRDTDFHDLAPDAQLNVEVDHLASQYYSDSPHFLPPPPCPTLYHGRMPITWNMQRFLHRHHGAPALRQRILEAHEHWTAEIFDSIAWDSFQSAMKGLPEFESTRIIKYSNRWSACATRMNDWDRSVNPHCPNCCRSERLPSQYDETEDHILRCRHDSLRISCLSALAAVEQKLNTLDTPRDVTIALIYGINSWIESERYNSIEPPIDWPPPNYNYHPVHHYRLQLAFAKQTDIGWDELLRGWLCTDWGEIVNQY